MLFGWLQAAFPLFLDAVVLYFLVKAPRRRFPLVAVFCAMQIVVTSAVVGVALISQSRPLYVATYWTGDLVGHAVISLLMISLIWQTLEDNRARKKTILLIGLGVICFALGSAYVFYDPLLGRWMTPLSRNLSFGEEVLNLILWSLLLKGRGSGYLLLMVSAGIGVQVTGEVIGHTLRLYTSRSIVWVPTTLVYVSEVVCLCIWVWAFRSAAKGEIPPTPHPHLREPSRPLQV